MASKAEVMRQRRLQREGFDVTCTIGRVVFGEGETTPHEAAFLLIAQHGAPGTFRFPAENGDEVEVTVNYTGA
jgi:hypothetical protein